MAAKLKPIDGKSTSWAGLWWHPEYNGFSSDAISLANLREFKGNVRLYVRKNKFFNGGENGRPNYTFCLRDANSKTFNLLEIEDIDLEDAEEDEEEEERLYTRSEMEAVKRGACIDGQRGYEPSDLLIEDYI